MDAELIELLSVFGGYLIFIRYGVDARRKYQLRIFRQFRLLLNSNLGVGHSRPIDDSACETGPGWRLLPLCFSLLASSVSLALVFEGRFISATNVMVMTLSFTYVAVHCSRPTVLMFGRLASLHQLTSLWLVRDLLDAAILKRTVLTRSFATIFFLNSADETLFHMLMSSWLIGHRLGWTHPLTYFPIQIFVLFLLPLQALGVRQWICSQSFFAERTSMIKREFLTVVSIPLMTILFAFAQVSEPQIFFRQTLMWAIGLANAFIFTACCLFGNTIDQVLMGRTMLTVRTSILQKEKILPVGDIVFFLTAVITLFMRATYLTLALTIIFFISRFPPTKIFIIEPWNRVVFYSNTVAVIHSLLFPSQNFLGITQSIAVSLFMTTRILCALEIRKFSLVQMESSALWVIVANFIQDDRLSSVCAFLSFGSVVISLLVVLSREHSAWMITRDIDSQAFVSHAIKQKLSGVGNAVEHVLESLSADNLVSFSSLKHLLRTVTRECEKSEGVCHSINLLRNLNQKRYQSIKSWRVLRDVVENWKASGALQVGQVDFSDSLSGTVFVEQDWEALRHFVCQWARDSQQLSIRCSLLLDVEHEKNAELCFQLIGQAPCGSKELNMRLAKHFNYKYLDSTTSTEFTVIAPVAPLHRPNNTADFLPQNLRFAIVDDNLLTRKNLERIVTIHLHANGQETFAMGATLEECMTFIENIVDQQTDIAIFDENLEFGAEGEYRSGTELGRMARRNGFNGCMILHSAQFPEELDASFDGFIEKTGSRRRIVEGILKAWQNFCHRKM